MYIYTRFNSCAKKQKNQRYQTKNQQLTKGKTVLMTPPSDGSILPGVIRQTVLDLLPSNFPEIDIRVSPVNIDYFRDLNRSGQMVEAFVTGTASTVGMVYSIEHEGERFEFEYGEDNLTTQIKKMVVDVQTGKVPHAFGKVIQQGGSL